MLLVLLLSLYRPMRLTMAPSGRFSGRHRQYNRVVLGSKLKFRAIDSIDGSLQNQKKAVDIYTMVQLYTGVQLYQAR